MANVGKRIGNSLYLHRSAVRSIATDEQKALIIAARKSLPKGFPWVVVKIDTAASRVSFITSPDWDTADEPTVGDSIMVDMSRKPSTVKHRKATGQVYHHKHMFVLPDYRGFDVYKSQKRSEFWQTHPAVKQMIDADPAFFKKIGNSDYWQNVLSAITTLHRPENTATVGGVCKSVKKYATQIKKSDRVLDYGAGHRRNTKFLISEGKNVTPYDTPKQMAKWGYTPELVGAYDWVFCSFVLNVLTYVERVSLLDDIKKHMKKNAKLVVEVRTMKEIEQHTKYRELFADGYLVGKGKAKTFQKGFTREELIEFLRSQGFVATESCATNQSVIVLATRETP